MVPPALACSEDDAKKFNVDGMLVSEACADARRGWEILHCKVSFGLCIGKNVAAVVGRMKQG